MNRQDLINRLVNQKLQAANDPARAGANKPICICLAGTSATPRQQTATNTAKQ